MSEPSLDLDKPSAVGTLDRITTNVAISLIAVVPTFVTCLIAPWRLAELLKRDDPEGRVGMLLSPGAFFALSLLVSMMVGALLTTPEIAQNDGSLLGPNLALTIQAAVTEGDVWKVVGAVLPIYVFAVLAGALGLVFKASIHADWTLRISLRAMFYVIGAFVSWVILAVSAIGVVRGLSDNVGLANNLAPITILPSLGLILWMYFWFFRKVGAISYFRSGVLAVAMFVLMAMTVVVLGTLDNL